MAELSRPICVVRWTDGNDIEDVLPAQLQQSMSVCRCHRVIHVTHLCLVTCPRTL